MTIRWFLGAMFTLPLSMAMGEGIDFAKQIRPILSNHCYQCHGPDAKERKAGLRLDLKDGAFGETESGSRAIVPSDTEASTLVERIQSTDADLRMPPAEHGKDLSQVQIDLLVQWVKEGAKWQDHWSFQPPAKPSIPTVSKQEWVSNAIDAFVLARLDKEGLAPSPPADKVTLIRRVTLDLTGLPPTIEEIDAFLKDESPQAYEKLVTRLLDSPRYGENMARYWLDAARYGDTHGLHLDNYRSMWPYRDWVINAFNDNMPFDQFTIEQLAGDLLPNPTLEQQIASGFNRCNVTTSEGGSIDEEFYVRYTVDRVETTGTVWMGLSLGCAVCHDHKYDPISQKEFYQLFAYFNNLTERAMDGNALDPPPVVRVPTDDQRKELAETKEKIAQLTTKLFTSSKELDEGQSAWLASWKEKLPSLWSSIEPRSMTSSGGSTFKPLEDKSTLVEGTNPEKDIYTIEALASAPISLVRLECLTDASMKDKGPGRSGNSNFVLSEFEMEAAPPGDPMRFTKIELKAAYADYEQSNGDYQAAKAIDGDLSASNGWAVGGFEKHENRTIVFVLKEPISFSEGTVLRFRIRQESQFAKHAIGRFRLSSSPESLLGSQGANPLELANLLASPTPTKEQSERLMNLFRSETIPGWASDYQTFQQMKAKEADLEKQLPPTLVMRERDDMREAFLLVRGEYDKKGEKVERQVPAFLPGLPEGAPTNRLGIARWLVRPEHPLTARVTVNRLWQQLFGVGIVKTAEDFGSQGEWPSHPELLDFLATEFASDWNIKRMIKLMIMSNTYRQSSQVTLELSARDPENRLLARGPRFRMDAEGIRDSALFLSGLYVEKIGGPSVKPYQPPGIWEAVAYPTSTTANFSRDTGESLYRRSLYTFWKRTAHHPALATFDAPSREACSVRRSRTNTPLQALVLMNDEQFVEAARAFAERLLEGSSKTDEERLATGFRMATSRDATADELAILKESLAKQRQRYETSPESAAKLVAVGESKPTSKTPAPELAAWTMTASLLLNLDEAITKG